MKNDPKLMKAKYSGKCKKCGKPIPPGEPIIYWPATHEAFHKACGEDDYRQSTLAIQDEDTFGNSCL